MRRCGDEEDGMTGKSNITFFNTTCFVTMNAENQQLLFMYEPM
jgi:hypothetical protein